MFLWFYGKLHNVGPEIELDDDSYISLLLDVTTIQPKKILNIGIIQFLFPLQHSFSLDCIWDCQV